MATDDRHEIFLLFITEGTNPRLFLELVDRRQSEVGPMLDLFPQQLEFSQSEVRAGMSLVDPL